MIESLIISYIQDTHNYTKLRFLLLFEQKHEQRSKGVAHLLTFDLTCCSHTSQPRQPIEMKCRQETSHVTLRALVVWPSNKLDERKLKKIFLKNQVSDES